MRVIESDMIIGLSYYTCCSPSCSPSRPRPLSLPSTLLPSYSCIYVSVVLAWIPYLSAPSVVVSAVFVSVVLYCSLQ